MPVKAMSFCAYAQCHKLVQSGYCPEHQAKTNEYRKQHRGVTDARYNANRPESDKFYGTQVWRNFRNRYLKSHPLCVECDRKGITRAARIVDHIEPFKLHPQLALDPNNMRSLCWPCHNKIGAKVRREGRVKSL